jgi:trk system potassium uptake protein TrkH
LPIAIGLQNGELKSLASLFATSFLSFGIGFVFNSFCERKELDEKTSLWLMLATFTILPMVLMIPFVWNNVFNNSSPFDLLTNSYFETISGFTTTGFTFVQQPEALPYSLLFYRSLVEFIGGVGFIYLLTGFFYPNDSLEEYANSFGIGKLSPNLRKVFASVILVYTFIVIIFTIIFYFTYYPSIIIASCTAIDVLTGGYQPNVASGIGLFQISILILMLLGSLNFQFHYNILHYKLRNLITPEIKLYLGSIVVFSLIICILAWINPFESLFNVVSMASSTGIDLSNIASSAPSAKIVFILIGLIGGCAFSMAGGIRYQRIKAIISAVLKKEDQPTHEELKTIFVYVICFVVTLVVLSLSFSTMGISLLDSVFEVGSAMTTNGISMGATTVIMPMGHKWLMIFAMLIGRIEILSIFAAISSLPLWEPVKFLGRTIRKTIHR